MAGEDVKVESVAQYPDELPQEAAMRLMRTAIENAERLRKMGAGRWFVDPKYSNMQPPAYRYIRLGSLADQSRRPVIEMQRYQLEQMGWLKAPPGTRNSLFAAEGEVGVYMCIPEPAARIWDDHVDKLRMEERRRRFGKTGQVPVDLSQLGPHVQIERADVTQQTTSIKDVMADPKSGGKRR